MNNNFIMLKYNKQKIYERMMLDISKIVKKQLNEMARKSVNRTIDKKLWLTVSSIISRNRSTEAENIKPIGTDKDNLLQRYVAALLIMKKPCPNNVSEIDDLKTFKNIGNKFIELGGTISEIRDLYNKNNGDVTSSVNVENSEDASSDNNEVENTPDNTSNNTSNKSSFFDDMFDENDEDEDNSLLGGLSNLDDTTHDSLMNSIATIDNTTSLDKAWYVVTKNANKPTGFKLIKSKNPTEYQKYEYHPHTPAQYQGVKLFKYLIKNGWKAYKGLGITNGKYDSYHTDFNYISDSYERYNMNGSYHIDNENTGIIPLHLTVNSTENDIIAELTKIDPLVVKAYKEDGLKRYYNEVLKIFKYNVSQIDNKTVKDIISNDSTYEWILVSPDGGLMLTKKVYFNHNSWEYNNYVIYDNDCMILYKPTGKINRYGPEYATYKCNKSLYSVYTLTFTGDVNYNTQMNDAWIDDQHTDDKVYNKKLKKAKAAFRKCLDYYGHNLIYALGWRTEQHKWGFDENGIIYVENTVPYIGWTQNDNLVDYYWGKKDKKTYVKHSHKNVKQFIKITTDEAKQKDPNVVMQVSDIKDRMRCTQYKAPNGQHRIVVTLDNDGIKDYKMMLKQ